jgi:hypothetical protein
MTIIDFLLNLLLAILAIFGIHADGELDPADLSVTITTDTGHAMTGCYQLGGPCDPDPWPDYAPGEHS